MAFKSGDPYVVSVPMQIYWDSQEALAQRDTHNSGVQQLGTVYIDPAYKAALEPAIPIRTAPAPGGYTVGWLNTLENTGGVKPIYIGHTDGNRQVKEVWIGHTDGNHKVLGLWIGTETGNKKVF